MTVEKVQELGRLISGEQLLSEKRVTKWAGPDVRGGLVSHGGSLECVLRVQ